MVCDQSWRRRPHQSAADAPISIGVVPVRPGSLEACLPLGTETPLTLALAYLKTNVQRINTTITVNPIIIVFSAAESQSYRPGYFFPTTLHDPQLDLDIVATEPTPPIQRWVNNSATTHGDIRGIVIRVETLLENPGMPHDLEYVPATTYATPNASSRASSPSFSTPTLPHRQSS